LTPGSSPSPHVGLFQKLLYTDPVQRKGEPYGRAFRDPGTMRWSASTVLPPC